jgi:hypothetical protein
MQEDAVRFNFIKAWPDSADSVDGIHQWWIQWLEPAESRAVTLAALEQLEREGVMEVIRLAELDLWRRRRDNPQR